MSWGLRFLFIGAFRIKVNLRPEWLTIVHYTADFGLNYLILSYLMTQTDSLGNTFRPSWAIIFCSFQFKCSWSDNPHRKNLDLPDYVRLQLDHNASRAFNHNAFRLLTSIMTRSARVLSRTKKASLFVILYFLELVFSGILPNISGAKAKQSLDIHSQYLTFIYGSAFSDQHLWAGA